MAQMQAINGETLTLTFVCIGQIFLDLPLLAVFCGKRPLLLITVQAPYLMVLLEGLQHILHVPHRWKTLLFSTGEKTNENQFLFACIT